MPHAPLLSPQSLHPSLWRGSQLARPAGRCVDTGFPLLSRHLPGQGWPEGQMIELLLPRAGIGELQLLAPALRQRQDRPIALLHPPHPPCVQGWRQAGLERLLWIRAHQPADACWAADQILRSGAYAALLCWQDHVRPAALRRLLLAAQQHDTLFFLLRPDHHVHQPCPAPLRLMLRPAAYGLDLRITKRQGSPVADWLPLAWSSGPAPPPRTPEPSDAYLPVDRRPSAVAQPAVAVPGLAA